MIKRKHTTEAFYAEENLHLYWVDTEHRELWIRGIDKEPLDGDTEEPGIEYQCATRINMNLNLLRLAGNEPITIHMQSQGGEWIQGMSIYDTIRAMPYHVSLVSYTHARSMSSIILQAADRRLLMPNSYVMLHQGTFGMEGEMRTVYSNVAQARKDDETMLNIYADRMQESKKFGKKSIAAIKNYLKREMEKKNDVFLTPKEAIDWGLADGIVEQWTEEGELI